MTNWQLVNKTDKAHFRMHWKSIFLFQLTTYTTKFKHPTSASIL